MNAYLPNPLTAGSSSEHSFLVKAKSTFATGLTLIGDMENLLPGVNSSATGLEVGPLRVATVVILRGNAPNTISLSSVKHGERVFDFRNTIDLQVTREDGFYVVEDANLGISVFAENMEDLTREISEQVCYMWDAYACEKNENLSPRALELKERLLDFMEELELAEK